MDAKPIICELGVLEPDTLRQRIQVFPGPGEYVHPKGPFTLTTDILAEFADNINAGAPIPVDRDHAFYKGLPAPAAGWFVPGSAEASEEGVTAEVDWTEEAADQIRKREYRMISPEWAFAKQTSKGQKVVEPTLKAASLTNRPFFDDMLPIAAEDLPLEDEFAVAEAFGDDVADLLSTMTADAAAGVIAAAMTKVGGKPGMAAHTAGSSYADPGYQKDGRKRYPLDDEEHVRAAWSYIGQKRNASRYTAAQLSRIKARIKRASKRFGITIAADMTEGGTMEFTALAEAIGLAADASEDELTDALKSLVAERDELKTKLDKSPSDDQMKTLIASAAKGEQAAAQLNLMDRDVTIKTATDEGKITPAQKDAFEGFWAIDPEGTKTLLANMAAHVPFVPAGSTDAAVIGADGQPLKDGETAITADTNPVMNDGVLTPVDETSAKLHAATLSILKSAGKEDGYTADEYAVAAEKAMKQTGLDSDRYPTLA